MKQVRVTGGLRPGVARRAALGSAEAAAGKAGRLPARRMAQMPRHLQCCALCPHVLRFRWGSGVWAAWEGRGTGSWIGLLLAAAVLWVPTCKTSQADKAATVCLCGPSQFHAGIQARSRSDAVTSRGCGTSPHERWSQLQLRGGAGLKRGVVINFLNGEKVEVSELDDIDSDDDMAGAQPVDWLPRLASDYLLPDERDLDTEDAGEEAEGDCEGSERRNGLWFQRAVLEAVYVRAQRVVRRVQHLWERAEPRTQAMAANKVSVTVRLYSVVHKLATSEKGVLNLLGCVGGEDDGEDSDQDSEPDLVWESEESETSESSEDEAEEERKVFQGEAMVLDKRVVLEAVRKLREVAEEAEVEYRPEVDSLLRQCRRLERLMALVSEDEATEASHHVFRGLLATLEDARKRIQPHCGLLFCAPVRDNSMRKVTEAAANISELVEEGGEAVLADLGRCNMSAPLVSNHDAWTCWRRGPGGAQAVAMPGVELARAISKTVQAMVRRTMVPGAQDDEEEDARNRRRHLPAAVATSAVAALAEVSVCGELSDAVSLLAMACMFPGRVSLLLSLEALLYSNQVREELALKRAREAGNFTRLSAAAAQPGDAPAEHAARELWRVGQKVVKELVYRARREEAAVGALLDAALMEVDVRALDTTPAPAPLPRARSEGNFSLILNQYAKQMRAALAARVAELHPPASALCITDQSNPGANQTSGVDELLLRSAEGGAAAACLHTTLHCGASLDARDARGNTPLHLAAGQGHVEVVRLLAYLGADTCANNLAGQTPDELAEKRGHRRAAQLLAELAAGSLVTGPATSQERLVEQASLLRIRDAARPLRPKRAANFTSDAPDPKTTRGSLGGGEAGVGVNAMGRIVLPSLWREARAHLRSPPTSPRSSPRRSASSPSRRRQATTLQPTKDQHHIAGLPFTTMAAAGILQDFGADGSASVWRTGANGQAEKNDSKDLGDGKDEDEDEDESESVTTTSSSSESDRWPAAAFQRRSQRHRRESYVRHETSRTLDMLPRQAPLRVPPDAEPAASCSSPLSPGKARLRRAPSQGKRRARGIESQGARWRFQLSAIPTQPQLSRNSVSGATGVHNGLAEPFRTSPLQPEALNDESQLLQGDNTPRQTRQTSPERGGQASQP